MADPFRRFLGLQRGHTEALFGPHAQIRLEQLQRSIHQGRTERAWQVVLAYPDQALDHQAGQALLATLAEAQATAALKTEVLGRLLFDTGLCSRYSPSLIINPQSRSRQQTIHIWPTGQQYSLFQPSPGVINAQTACGQIIPVLGLFADHGRVFRGAWQEPDIVSPNAYLCQRCQATRLVEPECQVRPDDLPLSFEARQHLHQQVSEQLQAALIASCQNRQLHTSQHAEQLCTTQALSVLQGWAAEQAADARDRLVRRIVRFHPESLHFHEEDIIRWLPRLDRNGWLEIFTAWPQAPYIDADGEWIGSEDGLAITVVNWLRHAPSPPSRIAEGVGLSKR